MEQQPESRRGKAWRKFADQVGRHIEEYTVPQYGDAGEDQLSDYGVEDCLLQAKKYINRYGKNVRPGQQRLDFLKAAHYLQVAAEKDQEQNQ